MMKKSHVNIRMSFTIEVSFDLRKRAQVSAFSTQTQEMAEKHGCVSHYALHECEGRGRVMERNHHVFISEYEDIETAAAYVREVRRTQYLYVESIYREDGKVQLLYASPRYLKRMDKGNVQAYKASRKAEQAMECPLMLAVRVG